MIFESKRRHDPWCFKGYLYDNMVLLIVYIILQRMVFHLPNEESLRTTNNYSNMFMLTLLWNVGLFGILVSLLFLLFYIIKKYLIRMVQNEQLRDSMITEDQRRSNNVLAERNDLISNQAENRPLLTVKNPTTISFRIVNIITSIFFYLFWIVVALIFLGLYMFNTFGRGAHIDVLAVFAMTCGVVIPTLIWKYYTKVTSFNELKGEVCTTVVLLVLWLGICVFAVIATKGACLCYFTTGYGFRVEKDLSLSTDFTRLMTLNQTCEDLAICHLYATVPEDTSTSVFFNAHSGTDLSNLTFVLKLNAIEVNRQISDQPFNLNNVESIGQRYVHSVLVTNLTANTTYSLEIYSQKGVFLKKMGYKTVPEANSTVKIASGGDLGMTDEGRLMTSYLKDFKPDIIVLGGDTVYDNGLRTCYYNWDIFYSMFEPVYEDLGRLVPLVMSIGNHDVGFDALDDVKISSTNEYLPLFLAYNPQHLSSQGGVPAVLQRKSYHYHKIGPSILFNMDSGYIVSHKDQVDRVEAIIKENPKLYRFANYHNPIYPACTDPTPGSNDMLVIQKGLEHWVPLFDRWNFTAVMEHHTHYRKMSYRIKNSTQDDQYGTRYIGDGSWGVPNQTCSQTHIPSHAKLLEDYAKKQPNHFWQIVVSKTEGVKPLEVKFTAIDMGHKVVTDKTDYGLPLLTQL